MQSEAIRGNQRQSEAIRGNQRHSEALRHSKADSEADSEALSAQRSWSRARAPPSKAINRQSTGNQQAINRQSTGNQKAINDTHLHRRQRGCPRCNRVIHFGLVGHTPRVRQKPGIVREINPVRSDHQTLVDRIAVPANDHVLAIGAHVRVRGYDAGESRTRRLPYHTLAIIPGEGRSWQSVVHYHGSMAPCTQARRVLKHVPSIKSNTLPLEHAITCNHNAIRCITQARCNHMQSECNQMFYSGTMPSIKLNTLS